VVLWNEVAREFKIAANAAKLQEVEDALRKAW
jgi:hypothetical protein